VAVVQASNPRKEAEERQWRGWGAWTFSVAKFCGEARVLPLKGGSTAKATEAASYASWLRRCRKRAGHVRRVKFRSFADWYAAR